MKKQTIENQKKQALKLAYREIKAWCEVIASIEGKKDWCLLCKADLKPNA